MFARCTNQNCSTDFDYRQGRFFRFLVRQPEGKVPPRAHPVRHFWLCRKCSKAYTLQYRDGKCAVVRREGILQAVTAA